VAVARPRPRGIVEESALTADTRQSPAEWGGILVLTGEYSLPALDLVRNAPRHVPLLITLLFALRLGPILTD